MDGSGEGSVEVAWVGEAEVEGRVGWGKGTRGRAGMGDEASGGAGEGNELLRAGKRVGGAVCAVACDASFDARVEGTEQHAAGSSTPCIGSGGRPAGDCVRKGVSSLIRHLSNVSASLLTFCSCSFIHQWRSCMGCAASEGHLFSIRTHQFDAYIHLPLIRPAVTRLDILISHVVPAASSFSTKQL